MPRPPPLLPSLRSDAVRNRDLVLEAAVAVFSELGTEASTEAIARRAGVGAGTVFRHFPTKEKLLEAVLASMFEQLTETAKSYLDASDPGAAFFEALERLLADGVAKKAVADALSRAGFDIRGYAFIQPMWETVGELLARAQAAEAVRADVGVRELRAVVAAASRAGEFVGKDDALREHVVGVVLDGLRRR